jgi:hypothetical protein
VHPGAEDGERLFDVEGNRSQEMHGVVLAGGKNVAESLEPIGDAEAIAYLLEATRVCVTNRNPLDKGMALIDWDKSRPEAEADNRDSELSSVDG